MTEQGRRCGSTGSRRCMIPTPGRRFWRTRAGGRISSARVQGVPRRGEGASGAGPQGRRPAQVRKTNQGRCRPPGLRSSEVPLPRQHGQRQSTIGRRQGGRGCVGKDCIRANGSAARKIPRPGGGGTRADRPCADSPLRRPGLHSRNPPDRPGGLCHDGPSLLARRRRRCNRAIWLWQALSLQQRASTRRSDPAFSSASSGLSSSSWRGADLADYPRGLRGPAKRGHRRGPETSWPALGLTVAAAALPLFVSRSSYFRHCHASCRALLSRLRLTPLPSRCGDRLRLRPDLLVRLLRPRSPAPRTFPPLGL